MNVTPIIVIVSLIFLIPLLIMKKINIAKFNILYKITFHIIYYIILSCLLLVGLILHIQITHCSTSHDPSTYGVSSFLLSIPILLFAKSIPPLMILLISFYLADTHIKNIISYQK